MIRVVLIDDEEDALDLLEILLGQIGDVEIVGKYNNPVKALEELDELNVDAVFLDNEMPGIWGTEAARRIRRRMPQMPIVFTTAHAQYAVEAFEIQSTDYLLKPFTQDRLQNAVARIRQPQPAGAGQDIRARSAVPVVQCLGRFHVQAPGRRSGGVCWRTKKEKELCALLVHHEGKAVSTAYIIDTLWPGHDLGKAKAYLYTCLSFLRKSLAENGVPIDIVKFDQGYLAALDEATVDVVELEALLSRSAREPEMDMHAYDRMNRLYQGEYMEACDFGWAAARQLELKAAYIRALRGWHTYFRSRGDRELAVDSLERVMTLVPESEADGRELIGLYLEAGLRNEAYRVCEQLEQVVCHQLGAELEQETRRLLGQTREKSAWAAR